MSDFAKLTDLFQEGTVLELARGDQTVTTWINKLSPFELEEARQDGRVARARTMLAIKEVGSPEYDLFRASLVGIGDEALTVALLDTKANEFLAAAIRTARSDKDWTEKIEVIEQSDLTGRAEDDPEVILLGKLTREYLEHIQSLADESRAEERALLITMARAQLESRYEEAYLDQRGLASFNRAYQATEVYHALRECKGRKVDGEWDHEDCDHNRRVCTRSEVERLPDSVWTQVREAIVALNMPVDVARFTAAPVSSSASSEQPNDQAAESTPSTPEEIPAEPVGTSS